ncbi:hypothetical protein EMIHUDRAFT_449790 [Emiliania huxleyi CCMP1516]|uniref:F-box domain-containing protein n=2 Tax=Emiliania huxleyi TaxID=2903 RepID=A0A0D3K324_EMIH1|nr:hypothetical protein EMIHUDRAFT_449790 [Emiliania huxleyi CCMP1516]EOD30159.1 hypothetical protein EMIHUDRAFT_449790 [Emiliania huxleyi CCMP1516]|eukprot:XP_005782588.1 hypothetical protein EMIHUDRAFT_449790 [Emiliania huxleyi CCMP1516]
MDEDAALAELCVLTGLEPSSARQLLAAAGNVELAASLYFDGSPGAVSDASDGEGAIFQIDDLEAPSIEEASVRQNGLDPLDLFAETDETLLIDSSRTAGGRRRRNSRRAGDSSDGEELPSGGRAKGKGKAKAAAAAGVQSSSATSDAIPVPAAGRRREKKALQSSRRREEGLPRAGSSPREGVVSLGGGSLSDGSDRSEQPRSGAAQGSRGGARCGPRGSASASPSVSPFHTPLAAEASPPPPLALETAPAPPRRRGGGGEEGSRCRAERAISRLLWDPTYDAVRAGLLVEWDSQQDRRSRRSGAAAWSARLPLDLWPMVLDGCLGRELCALAATCRDLHAAVGASHSLWAREHGRVLGEAPPPDLSTAAVRAVLRRAEARIAPWMAPPPLALLQYDGEGLLISADGGAETIYSMRDKLSTSLSAFSTEDEKSPLMALLTSLEDWLYEYGMDAEKSVYDSKYSEIMNKAGRSCKKVVRPPAPISSCVLLGESLAASASTDGAVRLWDPLRSSALQRQLLCARAGRILLLDIDSHAILSAVPPPAARSPIVAMAADDGRGFAASASLTAGQVHLWDVRLLPGPEAVGGSDLLRAGGGDLWMDLPPSARRALVGSMPLPVRGTTARQLHLDGSKLLVGIDGGVHCGTPFSCASQTVALYDMRALRGSSCSAPAARPLWEARVPGSATAGAEAAAVFGGPDSRRDRWRSAEKEAGLGGGPTDKKWRAKVRAARHADELLAEVEAEKRGKGKKGKKKKKGGGSGGAGPSQESEAPSEAAAAKPAKLDREGLIRLLETLHEERIRADAD